MGKYSSYILLDTSGSMDGEPIDIAKRLILDFVSALNNNSETSRNTDVSMLTYNMSVTEHVCKLPVKDFVFPNVSQIVSGPKNLGLALQTIKKTANNADITIIITKGNPSDIMLFNQESLSYKNISKHIIVLHGNIAKASTYSHLASKVISWDKVNMPQLVSQIFGGSEVAADDGRELLQAPPKTIEITI